MRAITQTLILFSIVMTSFISCDKDIPVQDTFDFTLEENHEEIAIINFPQKTTFTITPEVVVTTNTFLFSYEMLIGEGHYIFNGEALPQNESIELPELTTELEFVSPSLGTEKARVTVSNSGEINKTMDLIYEVAHNPFTIEASTPTLDINMNELKPFSVNLFNTGIDDSVTYARSFFIVQGEGEIYNDEGTALIPLEELQAIEEGTFNFKIKFSEFGESKLLVRAIDRNGQVKESEIVFNVLEVPLNFDVTTNPNVVFVGQAFTYNFNIPVDQGTGPQNKIRYVVEQGNAPTISYNGTAIVPNEPIDVPLSGNFTFDGVATTAQTLIVRFFLENNGTTVSEPALINVQSGDFTFEAIPNSLFGTVNQPMGFNGIITVNGPQRSPYRLIYSSNRAGTLNYNGTPYNAGDPIDGIEDLNFPFSYTGTEGGVHTLNFILFDVNNVQVDGPTVALNLTNADFTFTAESTSTTAFIDDCVNVNFTLDGDTNLIYTMKWTADIDGEFNLNGQTYGTNQDIIVENGNFNGCFRGLSKGVSNLVFEVTAGGESNADSVNITFDDYAIAITATSNIAELNECTDINFNLTGSINESYTMRWVADVEGQFTYNGITYSTGQDITLNTGFSTGCFTGLTAGLTNLTFTIDAFNNPKSETVDLTISEFDFTVSATVNEAPLSECTDLNFTIDGSNNLTYILKWAADVQGQFTYNNVTYNTNEDIIITQNNFTGCFTGLTAGVSNLNFTLSAAGVVVNKPVNLTIKEFDFTAQAVSNEAIINECTDININIDGSNNLNYTLKWRADVNGEFIIDGVPYSTNQPIPLTSLVTTGCFKGTSEGQSNLKFTLSASGIEKEQTVDLNIIGFNVSAAPVSPSAFIDECTDINFNIDGPNSLTYRMKWIADVPGEFTYNGTPYATNQEFVVPSGQFTGCFKASESGTSNLKFIISSVGITKTVSIDLLINAFSYTFTVPDTINTTAGDFVDFDMLYSTQVPSINSQIFHDISLNSSSLTNRLNNSELTDPFSLTNAVTTPLRLIYSEVGTHVINWTYTNSLGFSDSYTTTITVNDLNYNLNLESLNETIVAGETIDFDLSVIVANNTQNYTLTSYSLSSGSGQLLYNGSLVGNNFQLPSNLTTFTFQPSSYDDVTLVMNVVDDFGQAKTISKTVGIDIRTNFTSSVSVSGNLPCGTQNGEQKYRRKSTRRVSVTNNNLVNISDVEVSQNGSVVWSFPNVIPPSQAQGGVTNTCFGSCTFITPSVCSPNGSFEITYKLNGIQQPVETINF